MPILPASLASPPRSPWPGRCSQQRHSPPSGPIVSWQWSAGLRAIAAPSIQGPSYRRPIFSPPVSPAVVSTHLSRRRDHPTDRRSEAIAIDNRSAAAKPMRRSSACTRRPACVATNRCASVAVMLRSSWRMLMGRDLSSASRAMCRSTCRDAARPPSPYADSATICVQTRSAPASSFLERGTRLTEWAVDRTFVKLFREIGLRGATIPTARACMTFAIDWPLNHVAALVLTTASMSNGTCPSWRLIRSRPHHRIHAGI